MRRAAPAVPRRKRADLRRGPGDASERTPGSPPGAGPRRGPAGSADGRRHPPHVGRSRRPHPRLIVIPRSRQPRIPCTPTEWPPTGRGPLGRAPSADRRSRVDRCRPVRGVEIADDHVHPGTVGGGAAHRRPDPAGEIGQRLAVAAVDLHEDPVSPHPHPRDPATRQVRRHLSPPNRSRAASTRVTSAVASSVRAAGSALPQGDALGRAGMLRAAGVGAATSRVTPGQAATAAATLSGSQRNQAAASPVLTGLTRPAGSLPGCLQRCRRRRPQR